MRRVSDPDLIKIAFGDYEYKEKKVSKKRRVFKPSLYLSKKNSLIGLRIEEYKNEKSKAG